MKVVVQIYPSSSGPSRRSEARALEIACGQGEQLVRWLAYAACLKLEYVRRGVTRKYLPQAVIGKDGLVIDVDHVLKEVIKDGDEVYVEYGPGPKPFTSRWEGRPETPEFNWGDDGVVLPRHDVWLQQLDLVQEGVDQLVDPESCQQDAGALTRGLSAVKELLTNNAGSLQACFLAYEFQGDKDPQSVGRMNLTQFKAFCSAAKLTVGKFNGDRLDDIFTAVAASPAALKRKMDSSATSTITFADFLILLAHLAYHRFASMTTRATIHVNVQKPDLARHTQLSDKMDDLLTDCIAKNIYPELSARIATFAAVHPKAVAVMLSKGRRLIEQTLDSCQMKRSKCAEVEVELKHVARHLGKWRILGLDILFPDLAAISLHAKHRSPDVAHYRLLQQPIVLNYDEFETMILSIALHMYHGNEKAGSSFDEFLGTFMDRVFRTSGVLVDAAPE